VKTTPDNARSGSLPAPNSLRHVAELAGVSVATASRVMSGSSHPVGEWTRQRVLSAASALQFEPNRLARALVTARSQTIGVIVHDISDPYFGDIVKGLEDGLYADDYHLFVASSERNAHKELSYIRAFHSHQVDGIVFAASSLTDPDYLSELNELVSRYRAGGGVVVMASDHAIDGPRVRFDNPAATAAMVRYLHDRGHERIGFIGGPTGLRVSAARLEGYLGATEQLGLRVRPEYLTDGRFTIQGGEAAMANLREHADVTAVLSANDLMAIGATRHLLASGVAVPDDVSVVGVDDLFLAEYAPVPLTTWRVPTYDIGRSAATVLIQALRGEETEDPLVEGKIIERESVARLSAK
jgi:LacI family transcriptional regulator